MVKMTKRRNLVRSCSQLSMDGDLQEGKFIPKDDRENIMEEFRRRLQNVLRPQHDDMYLYRFLKARNFDLEKAEKMIRETLKFREKFGVDALTSAYDLPEVIVKHPVTYSLGFDKDNNPVRLFMLGLADCRGITSSIPLSECLKLTMFYLESDIKMMRDSLKKGEKMEEKIVFIIDFTNFSLKQFYDKTVITTGLHMLSMYQDNYPETLKAAYLTNVPSYFNWLFNIFKPVLNQVTLSKIKVYKGNFQEELRSIMNPNNLPAFLGGDLTDPDGSPLCKHLVNWSDKKVHSSYYMRQNEERSLISDESANVITVAQRSLHQVPVEVPVAESVLKWTFWTKECNIRFGVFYKRTNDSAQEEVLPVEGVDCQVIAEENQIVCERPGTYILHFDNTYSWWTSKQVWYKVEVSNHDG